MLSHEYLHVFAMLGALHVPLTPRADEPATGALRCALSVVLFLRG